MNTDLIVYLVDSCTFCVIKEDMLAETHFVKASTVRVDNRGCRKQKILDYEIETRRIISSINREIRRSRKQKILDYEIETTRYLWRETATLVVENKRFSITRLKR